MANYKIKSLRLREKIETAWNTRCSIAEIGDLLGGRGYQTVYRELRLGEDGTYLPCGKKRYCAKLAFERDVEDHERFLITLDQRKLFETLYAAGVSYEEIRKKTVFKSKGSVHNEVNLGSDGLYSPNGRKNYSAELAQQRYMSKIIK